jgi:ABC-2 type transport system ATP-binding protein
MIRIENLTIRYDDLVAVRSANLEVPAGSVFGLVGPNGAGKTSMIRALVGLLVPDEGQLEIGGIDVQADPAQLHPVVGYMPDFFGVYDQLAVREYLEFFGRLYGLPRGRIAERTVEVLALTDLTEKVDSLVGGLSRGMKQRLCVARCLLHDPQVLLLDEPASGVDPRGRYELRRLIGQLGAAGKTILVSSHILPELADVCDSVGIMERGKILVSGPVDQIAGQVEPLRTVKMTILDGRGGSVQSVLEGFEPLRHLEVQGDAVEVRLADNDEAMAELIRRLVGNGLRIGSITEQKADLEELYLRLTHGEVA